MGIQLVFLSLIIGIASATAISITFSVYKKINRHHNIYLTFVIAIVPSVLIICSLKWYSEYLRNYESERKASILFYTLVLCSSLVALEFLKSKTGGGKMSFREFLMSKCRKSNDS